MKYDFQQMEKDHNDLYSILKESYRYTALCYVLDGSMGASHIAWHIIDKNLEQFQKRKRIARKNKEELTIKDFQTYDLFKWLRYISGGVGETNIRKWLQKLRQLEILSIERGKEVPPKNYYRVLVPNLIYVLRLGKASIDALRGELFPNDGFSESAKADLQNAYNSDPDRWEFYSDFPFLQKALETLDFSPKPVKITGLNRLKRPTKYSTLSSKPVPSEPEPLSAKAGESIYGPGMDEFGFPIPEETPKKKSTKHDDIKDWFKPKERNFLQEMDWDSLDESPKKKQQAIPEAKPLQSAAAQPPAEKKLTKKELLQLMDRWNSYPHTPKHKTPDTKVFKDSMKMLNALRAGSINTKESKKALFLLDEEFCDKFDLPRKIPTFNLRHIETMMDRVASMYEPHYGGGKYMPNTLVKCLYNPEKMNSKFIQFYYDPPKLLKEKHSDSVKKALEPDVQQVVDDVYSTMGTINRIYPQESPTITNRIAVFYDVVSDLLDYCYETNKQHKDIIKRLEEYLPCAQAMVAKYLAFLKRKNLTELKFYAFHAKTDQDNPLADNFLFQEYLREQSRGIGVDLIYGGYL